ncbi:MAG: hypothetical protein ACRD2L_23595 [Terriglobia bacterium]
MPTIVTVGIDLAKNVFAVRGFCRYAQQHRCNKPDSKCAVCSSFQRSF